MIKDLKNSPEVCFGKNSTDIVYNQITLKGPTPDDLELKIFFHGFYSFNGNSTLIYGKKDAVLVSTAFLKSDAYRLVAGILETGKNLTHVIIPEFHPDHHFCSQIVQDAFPDAKFVALQSIVRDVVLSADDKIQLWGKLFGKNVPDRLHFPMPLADGRLEIEGKLLELSDGWQGDQGNETLVWIPSLRVAITSDTVFYRAHPWTIESDAARRSLWRDDLRKLREKEPRIVVPGHVPIDKFMVDGTTAIDFTIKYLEDFEVGLAQAKTGDELVDYMESRYPDMEAIRFGLHWQARFAFPDACSDRITPIPGIFHVIGKSENGDVVYE
ncbi:MAG: MBL fold metallo-hydrolase [Desulfuromonadaceae bacterium]|nr:MBL fold metallo-hydrolase [Desulfuromonadaceae bacterium]